MGEVENKFNVKEFTVHSQISTCTYAFTVDYIAFNKV